MKIESTDLTREPFYGGEQWASNGRIVARAEYPVGETVDSARSAGLFEVIFDDLGVYDGILAMSRHCAL